MPFQNLNQFVWWGHKYYMQVKYAIMPILKELSSSCGHKFTPKAEHTMLQMLRDLQAALAIFTVKMPQTKWFTKEFIKEFYMFLFFLDILYSQSPHLFYRKNSHIVKYYYNLK